MFSDGAPRLLQENQKYLSQLTNLMQEAADEQAKSIVVSSWLMFCFMRVFAPHLSFMQISFNLLIKLNELIDLRIKFHLRVLSNKTNAKMYCYVDIKKG